MATNLSPKAQEELAELARKLATTAETRRAFTKLVKQVEPSYSFPDQTVEDLREELAAKAEKDREDAAHKAALDRLQSQRTSLLGSYDENQVKEIEKVMETYGLADYQAGAKLYAADHRPTRETGREASRHGATWELPTFEGLLENPVKAARNMAHKVIDEINSRR